MSARLEARRDNNEPKCANCQWWRGKETAAGRCDQHDIMVLDLMVCSTWRDSDVVADVLPPEEPWPEGVPKWRTEE